MCRARRSCGTVAATWLRESCAACTRRTVIIFIYVPIRYEFPPLFDCLPAAPRRPGSPASGASRVPPPTPAAARLGSRPSRSPVGREPARRRAARRAEGSGLKTRGPRPGRRGKSVDARHDHTRRPSSDAKYGTDSRGESAKARARGLSTPARGANRAPCQGREARGNGRPRAGGPILAPPNCSGPRRSAKIQKVWLSCVAR